MKTRNLIIMAVIMFGSSTLFSCTDSCNKKLGDTFNSIEAASALLNTTNQNVSLVFNTNTLTDLPEQYFIDGILYDELALVDSSKVDTFYSTSEKMKIVLTESEAPELNSTQSYKFQFHFGDRRTYIDCKHPGMADSYQLDLNFDLTNNNSNLDILNFSWVEYHSAGAF